MVIAAAVITLGVILFDPLGDGDGGSPGTTPATTSTEGGSTAAAEAECGQYRSSLLKQLREARIYQEQVILFVEQASRGEETTAVAPVVADNLARVRKALTAVEGLGPPPASIEADVTAVREALGSFVERATSMSEGLEGGTRPGPGAPTELTELYRSQPAPKDVDACG